MSADKYRILPFWGFKGAILGRERDRLQAEYIAASEETMGVPSDMTSDDFRQADLSRFKRFYAARAALLKHMEEHP
jgi:hypothetical protein